MNEGARHEMSHGQGRDSLVRVVLEFYDRPRRGIADFDGKPVYFECVFDEGEDEWTDSYRLIPVTGELVTLARERDEIFQDWRKAFDAGAETLATHPARPPDRARFELLSTLVEEHLQKLDGPVVTATGRFFSSGLGSPAPPLDRFDRVSWEVD
jgi:hypothetical protein